MLKLMTETPREPPTGAALARIRAFAEGLDQEWSWNRDVEAALFLCADLRQEELRVAMKAHSILYGFAVGSLAGVGGMVPEMAGLMEALKDFAECHGWVFEEGEWRPYRQGS